MLICYARQRMCGFFVRLRYNNGSYLLLIVMQIAVSVLHDKLLCADGALQALVAQRLRSVGYAHYE